MATFPNGIYTATNPTPGSPRAGTTSPANEVTGLNQEVEAIEAALGVGLSNVLTAATFTGVDGNTKTIEFKRNPAATWASINPILAAGEPGVESDTGNQKIGDGVTHWNVLAYSGGALTSTLVDGGNAFSSGAMSIDGGASV